MDLKADTFCVLYKILQLGCKLFLNFTAFEGGSFSRSSHHYLSRPVHKTHNGSDTALTANNVFGKLQTIS